MGLAPHYYIQGETHHDHRICINYGVDQRRSRDLRTQLLRSVRHLRLHFTTAEEMKMSVTELRSWRTALFTLLNSEQTVETIIAFICNAYKVPRDEVVAAWNDMLCAKHGI